MLAQVNRKRIEKKNRKRVKLCMYGRLTYSSCVESKNDAWIINSQVFRVCKSCRSKTASLALLGRVWNTSSAATKPTFSSADGHAAFLSFIFFAATPQRQTRPAAPVST